MLQGRWTQLRFQHQANSEQLLWESLNYNNAPLAPPTPAADRPEGAAGKQWAGPVRTHEGMLGAEAGRAHFDAATGKMVVLIVFCSPQHSAWLTADKFCLAF
jgi:hypothetical protein